MSEAEQKIPAYIISGFLGSGKTTMLVKGIQSLVERKVKFGILVNEIGEQDVDGELLGRGEEGLTLEKILDGCVCCNKKSELTDSLLKLLLKEPKVILIELTGIAHPDEIADALTDPELIHRIQLQRVYTIIDAEKIIEYNSIFSTDKALVQTLRSQMEAADLLVVNKTDQVTEAHLGKVEKVLRKHNQTAEIVYTTYSSFDMERAFPETVDKEASLSNALDLHNKTGKSALSHSRFRTLTLRFDSAEQVRKKDIEKFIKKCRKQLLRAKGFILNKDEEDGMLLIQYDGTRISWESSAYSGSPYLVLIGLELNEEAIKTEWNKVLG